MSLNLLVVASETPDQQTARRKRAGAASHETYSETLRRLDDAASISHAACLDPGNRLSSDRLRGFDGVLFAGSPIQMNDETAETRAAARFMRDVFEAGTPAFGSCAGLQIAAVAAGGSTRPRRHEMEAGFARNITATPDGRGHTLLAGRRGAWDAPAMHSSVVDALPEGSRILAETRDTPVEAAEIRCAEGVFWGVQYHPEITLREIASALRGQSSDLIAQGLAADVASIDRYALALETLDRTPERRDLAWQLGLDAEIIDVERRTLELRNFLGLLRGRV